MISLKSRLLDLGVFEDNEYLDLYCYLISENRERKKEFGKTQKHHIIPRAWYRMNGKKLDNTEANLVNLGIAEHVKAHFYLYKAASDPTVKGQNAAAVRYMCDLFDEQLIEEYADELEFLSLQLAQKKSKELAARRAAGLNERRRAVMCIETGQVFNTIKEAQETTGLWIKQQLKGLTENAGGYHFKYVEGETPKYKPKKAVFTSEELAILKQEYYEHGTNISALLQRHSAETIRCKASELKLIKKHSNKCRVRCVETDTVYPTLTAASEAVSVNVSNIVRACKAGKTSGGYHWEYADF